MPKVYPFMTNQPNTDKMSDADNFFNFLLVSSEDVSCIDLFLYIIKAGIIAVGYDGIGLCLELGKVVDNEAAEEGAAVFEGWLIYDDIGALSLDALHDALDGGLTEVVRIGFHGQAIETDGD